MNRPIGLLLCLLALPLSAETFAALSIRNFTTTTGARPNSIFNYLLTIQNSGNDTATNVVVTDVLPADLLFEAIAPGFFTSCTTPAVGTSGTVTCAVATLPVGEGIGFSLQVRVAPGARPGVVTTSATVTSTTPDTDHGDNTAAAPPLTIAPPVGVERRLDPGAPPPPMAAQMGPQVATTRQNALAVWAEGYVDFAPPGSAASIRGALFRPEAQGETTIESLIDFAAPEWAMEFAFPVVAAAGDRYLVVWRESGPVQARIMARRLRVDGSFLDAQPLVLETGSAVPCCTNVGDPRPAVASNGRDFYVSWVSASYDVRGIAVPAEGPVVGTPSILSRETDTRTRGHHDLEVVWTSALYVVAWLDRVFQPPVEQPLVLRYARVTSDGVLLDPQRSNSIAGRAFSSITATPDSGGAVVTVDYVSSELPVLRQCVDALPLTADGQPGDPRQLRCETSPGPPEPALHSTLIPVATGYLLVQPGRGDQPSFQDFPLRTSTAAGALTQLSYPMLLGTVAREVSVANWRGTPLLVYNRTDGDDPATRVARVFAFLIQGPGRIRTVRH